MASQPSLGDETPPSDLAPSTGAARRRMRGVVLVAGAAAAALLAIPFANAITDDAPPSAAPGPVPPDPDPSPTDEVPVPPSATVDPALPSSTPPAGRPRVCTDGSLYCTMSNVYGSAEYDRSFLEPVPVGQGGLRATTVSAFGTGGTVVGDPYTLVESVLLVDLSATFVQTGACTVRVDPSTRIGVVIGPDGESVQTYLYANSVFETTEGVKVGSTFEDLLDANGDPTSVHEYDDGSYLLGYGEQLDPSSYSHVEPGRTTAFELTPEGIVSGFRVGTSSWAALPDLCPEP